MEHLGTDSSALLADITRSVVQAHKTSMGKGPERVKSYFLDDMLVVVSKGGITTAERTMLDAGQEDPVREFRRLFEIEMTEHLTKMISELTGREVIAYVSQTIFAPDRVIAVYVFNDSMPLAEERRPAEGR